MKKTISKLKKNKTGYPEYFLETSIAVKLLFGHSSVKETIRKEIKGANLHTSLYVLMEYKRLIVKTLIEFYYVVKEEDSPGEALSYYTETFSNRGPKVIISALGQLVAESDLTNDKEKFLLKLETLIESAIRHLGNLVSSKFVPNKTHCPLAKASIEDGFDHFLEEIECKAECSVDVLWKENKSNLKRFSDEAGQAPHLTNNGFKKPLPLIEGAITNPTLPKSKNNCKKVGDFIIALEMPKHMRLLTFDKAFDSICKILRKDFKILPSPMSIQSHSS